MTAPRRPTDAEIESWTYDQMLAYYIEALRQYLLAYNASMLKDCLRLCGDSTERCHECVLGSRILRVDRDSVYFEDGTRQSLRPEDHAPGAPV